MMQRTSDVRQAELRRLLDLSQRVGNDPLLTQASTGNSSAKLDGVLWIKASGKWMADAIRDDIFISLNLSDVVTECLRQHVDPAGKYPGASLETALHAVLPHRMVLHVHCVNTIAWAVRRDGPVQLQRLLEGLPWQWIPYAPSGLPLSRAIERALSAHSDTDLFVLGNHGLVVCGEDPKTIEDLLTEVRQRVAIYPRKPHPADYAALWEMSRDTPWDLPEDDVLHAFGTDRVSQAILREGILYPCQAIFSKSRTPELFRPIPYPNPGDDWQLRYYDRSFLIIEGRGVIIRRTIAPSELAMISGLAQVVQRLNTAAPLRYLTEAEIADIPGPVAYRYRDLASARYSPGAR
jgi:rhamnose utilization protein RhaD (predicted bifunctional aldolase and dehydrogenase)